MTREIKSGRLARKEVEQLLALLRKLARDHNGTQLRFAECGSGHIAVCDADLDPYTLPDGRTFTVPTTPQPRGGWKQRAIHNAVSLDLIDERHGKSVRRKATEKLRDELEKAIAERSQIDARISSLQRKIA